MDWVWALIAVSFLLAGAVKGIVGLGLPTVAIGLLSLAMMPAQAAALLVVPSLVTNIWQLFGGPNFIALTRRLAGLLIGLFAGTLAGGWFIPIDDSGRATVALGAVLIVYAAPALLLPRFSVPRHWQAPLSPFIGLLTGVVSASTGVFVVPMVPYIQALDLERDDLVQALGIAFTVATVALAGALAHNGQIGWSVAGPSVLALLAALAGMYLGQKVRERTDPAKFRIFFFIGMLLLGAHLVLRGACDKISVHTAAEAGP